MTVMDGNTADEFLERSLAEAASLIMTGLGLGTFMVQTGASLAQAREAAAAHYTGDTAGGRALVALDHLLEGLRRFGTDRSLLADVQFCIDQDPPSPQFRITDGGVAYWLCSHRPQPHAQPV